MEASLKKKLPTTSTDEADGGGGEYVGRSFLRRFGDGVEVEGEGVAVVVPPGAVLEAVVAATRPELSRIQKMRTPAEGTGRHALHSALRQAAPAEPVRAPQLQSRRLRKQEDVFKVTTRQKLTSLKQMGHSESSIFHARESPEPHGQEEWHKPTELGPSCRKQRARLLPSFCCPDSSREKNKTGGRTEEKRFNSAYRNPGHTRERHFFSAAVLEFECQKKAPFFQLAVPW